MKRLLLLLIILAALGGILYYKGYDKVLERWINFSFCDEPVTYRLGSIDPRFNKSQEEVLESIKAAGDMWNQMAARDLFLYDPQSELEINLVYDERQEALDELNQKRSAADQEKESLEEDVEEFLAKKDELEKELYELNEEIKYWNQRGGAPKEEYEEIIMKQSRLNREINRINQAAEKLNMTTQKINQKVDSVNKDVQKFNSLLTVKP
jgi:chromosome segregation ATPase